MDAMMTDRGGAKGARRLLCFYGDDFTGSTDVLEALYRGGFRTVLFLEPPTPELLEEGRFRDVECFGVAGVGRSLTPEEMERELPPVFRTLRSANAAVVHYKVCSTFDSSPRVGSIGKAAELGRGTFGGGRFVPVVAGVPYLGRYTVFGNHFAAADGAVHRLDRHPTMSRHPVTPMAEADLRRHLALQTELRIGLVDVLDQSGSAESVRARLEALLARDKPELVLFDVLDDERLRKVGRLIWEEASRVGDGDSLFAIGSSGIEYALAEAMAESAGHSGRAAAGGDAGAVGAGDAAPTDRLLVVSGSCSPATERQIARALEAGYVGLRVPAGELAHPGLRDAAVRRLRAEAAAALDAGRSVLLYSALGPGDEAIAAARAELAALGLRAEDSSRVLGSALGALARELVAAAGLTRLLIAGGDTSGYVARELGVYALECKAALTPGAPLCAAYSADPVFDGLELVLKGGQIGGPDFFEEVRLGKSVGSSGVQV
ncbi:four-carbon acid sugar kinase family protein [Paenibacillus sp.]|uniref:four-carbon acid sugar kinase family protein n=1 Tax=Paenibacillus sp. TaxID=58172 RepID=UPI002D24F829|nr:four-carbon acid sugar kinase family protein [Paenibacillus sp.]HZG83757.1 four-carbon acid sugar kinase family protein [Paenibacillus sp.]